MRNAFLILVFVILPACGIVHLLRVRRRLRDFVRAKAAVVGFEEFTTEAELRIGGLSRTRLVRRPMVRFGSDGGKIHTVTLRDELHMPGGTDPKALLVIYPYGHPERAQLADARVRYTWPLFWFLPALAVLLAVVGFTLQYYATRQIE